VGETITFFAKNLIYPERDLKFQTTQSMRSKLKIVGLSKVINLIMPFGI